MSHKPISHARRAAWAGVLLVLCAAGAIALKASGDRAGDASAADSMSSPATQPAEAKAAADGKAPGWNDKTDRNFPPPSGPGTSELLMQMLTVVIVVVVLGVVALVVIRRLLPRIGVRSGRRMSVIESMHIEPRKLAHLIQVGDRTFLIASTAERVTMLGEVTGAFGRPVGDDVPAKGGKGAGQR